MASMMAIISATIQRRVLALASAQPLRWRCTANAGPFSNALHQLRVAARPSTSSSMLTEWLPLRAHVLTMLAGQCFTAFFAVWTVHHDCQPIGRLARTQRGWLKNVVSYDMFHHVEHHLFPAVPTCHLPELSRRLDRVAPDYKALTVF